MSAKTKMYRLANQPIVYIGLKQGRVLALAVAVTVAVAVGFVSFGATIRRHIKRLSGLLYAAFF